MKSFQNATAVVTGAGSGIGRAIALRLSAEGATVHCVDRNLANALAVADECVNGKAHQVDVTDVVAVEALANRIFAAGPVDILINNAGIAHSGTILDSEVNDFRRLLEVNVMGVVHGLHAFLPRMLAQKTPAHIVNTASGAGLFASPGIGPYCASKHAVVGLSQVLAAELHNTPVAVTILCPGIVNTPIIQTAAFRGQDPGPPGQDHRLLRAPRRDARERRRRPRARHETGQAVLPQPQAGGRARLVAASPLPYPRARRIASPARETSTAVIWTGDFDDR
jgi:NAD(P)-dependent dehydrogenase (short-subunit alcohol dehydrogenase family)